MLYVINYDNNDLDNRVDVVVGEVERPQPVETSEDGHLDHLEAVEAQVELLEADSELEVVGL